MKREPITIGQECAFWTVTSGPIPGSTQKTWKCRCRCGREREHMDHNLKNIRDGRSNERYWSCGCVAKELRKVGPRASYDHASTRVREFVNI